jgi:hypothetical protein
VIAKRTILSLVVGLIAYLILYISDIKRVEIIGAYCLTACLVAFFLFPQKESNQPA